VSTTRSSGHSRISSRRSCTRCGATCVCWPEDRQRRRPALGEDRRGRWPLTARIDALDQKIDGVDARLTTKIDGLDRKIDDLDSRLTTKFDSLRTEMGSLKGELLAEIRRVDVRIDSVDRELRTAIDSRERLAALEARRVP
jgi:chromosome segregation ATPase